MVWDISTQIAYISVWAGLWASLPDQAEKNTLKINNICMEKGYYFSILFWWFHQNLWNPQKFEKQVIDLYTED